MSFRHPPCHSAIHHVIPPSVTGLISPFRQGGKLNIMLLISLPTSFRHPPPHSAIHHPRPNCFHHLPRYSSHRPSGPILILSRWQAQHITFDQPPHLILPSVTHSAIRHKSSVPISPLCQDSKLDIPLLISLPSHSTIRHVILPSVTYQFPPYSTICHKSLGPISPHHQGTKVTKLYIPILIRITTLTESED